MNKPDITKREWHTTGLEIRAQNSMILANVYKHLEINQSIEEATANAKAISAVPEMINALIEAVKDHDDAWNLLNADTYNMCVKALEKAGCTE